MQFNKKPDNIIAEILNEEFKYRVGNLTNNINTTSSISSKC